MVEIYTKKVKSTVSDWLDWGSILDICHQIVDPTGGRRRDIETSWYHYSVRKFNRRMVFHDWYMSMERNSDKKTKGIVGIKI